jgi:MarR family transcriptional regulator, organic hydroperoxide resistance regulator
LLSLSLSLSTATAPLAQARISELTGIDPMTTSQIVRALGSAALLERREPPTDPRALAIVVTRAGREKAKEAVVVVEATDAAFFEPITRDTPRLVALFKALVPDE